MSKLIIIFLILVSAISVYSGEPIVKNCQDSLAWLGEQARLLHREQSRADRSAEAELDRMGLEQYRLEIGFLEDSLKFNEKELETNNSRADFWWLWKDDTLGFSVLPWFGRFRIAVSEGTLKVFGKDALVLSFMMFHELEHILGNKNLPTKLGLMLLEGEADYGAGRRLVSYISKLATPNIFPLDQTQVRLDLETYLSPRKSLEPANRKAIELAAMASYRALRHVYSTEQISFLRRDTTVVNATVVGYPSPQARLDTILAGILGEPRPQSWAYWPDFAR